MKRRSFFRLAAVLPVAFWAAGRPADDWTIEQTCSVRDKAMEGDCSVSHEDFSDFIDRNFDHVPMPLPRSPEWYEEARKHKRNVERFGFGLGPE